MDSDPDIDPEPEDLDRPLSREELLSDLLRADSSSPTPTWSRLLLYGAGSLTLFLAGLVVGGMIPRSTVRLVALVGLVGLVLPLLGVALYGMSR